MEPQSITRWVRIWAMIPTTAMIFMDQSILPVALPTIQRDFGAEDTSLQWTVNAYFLTIAIFLIVAGKIGDRVGHRKLFLWGMVSFAFFSALCGLSQNIESLIAARALQGIGAAILFPLQTSLIASSFPKHSRGRATGLIVSIGSIFLVLGPLIGGYLTEVLSWKWIFWINLPISLIGVCLALALLSPSRPNPGKTDLPGFFYFFIFATSLTIFFMQIEDWGWGSTWTISSIILAIISGIFLIRREKASKNPFMELSLFRHPLFSAINVSVAITQFVLMIFVFRTIYLQEILGYSAIETGVISALTSAPVLFLSYIGGFLSDKISPKLPISLGYLCLITSFFWLGFFSTPSTLNLCLALLVFGMGIPLILTPSYTMAMHSVPPSKFGVGFGMISTTRMFAGTVGLALIHLFVSVEQAILLPKAGEKAATIASFSSIHFLLGIIMIIAFITSYFLHKRKSAHQLPESPVEGWD